jgi:hypothetical protein
VNTDDRLLAEYQATQATYLHYDAFRWQAGSILIAGVFVFWGFLLTAHFTNWETGFGLSSLVVAALMSIWLLFAQLYRHIYLYKLHRIGQLEATLGFCQHRRFVAEKGSQPEYIVFGPKGHSLDRVMYCGTSLGTSFLGVITHGFSIWLLAPLPITLGVLLWVLINDRRTTSRIKRLAA